MDFRRANVLIIVLAALSLLLITLALYCKQGWLLTGAALCYLLLMLVWFLFNRCPHCGKHLGQHSGIYCPHCKKKL